MEKVLKNEFDTLNNEYKAAINAASFVAEKNKINIFLIGGIVRDLIMQNPIKDIDIAVEADAIEFAKKLEKAGFEILSIQENLRTVKARYKNGIEIDFASTREEIYPVSGNLPVITNFGCELEKDIKRRDFTINTLAIILTGEKKYSLIDYFDGYSDIQNKKIKILHEKSFMDDPSRIVRALKFKVRFNFDIDENTNQLMKTYLQNVNPDIPLERIKNEFKQYFSVNDNHIYDEVINTQAYKLISDDCILNFNYDYFEEIQKYNLFDDTNKWFIFILLVIFKSDFALSRLNLTSSEKKSVTDLREIYNGKIKKDCPSKFRDKPEGCERNLGVVPLKGEQLNGAEEAAASCDTRLDNYEIYKFFQGKSDFAIAAYYIITGSNYVIKFLKELRNTKVLLSGNDLIEMGLKPSPLFNEIFEKILKQKLNGNLLTIQEERDFVKSYLI